MKIFKKIRFTSLILSLVLLFIIAVPTMSIAADQPIAKVELGAAENFAVLAGSGIENTGPTVISGVAGGNVDGNVGGNVGVHPNTSITGFPPGQVFDGTIHIADNAARDAKTALENAFADAGGRVPTRDLTGTDLGGLTLTSGVYSFSTSAQLTGTLTLSGDENDVFIFQIGSTLTTASNSKIVLTGNARFCRIFWLVGSSATLGTSTDFKGHILAMASITATTGATVQGQLLARSAVTLDSNTITNGFCNTILASSSSSLSSSSLSSSSLSSSVTPENPKTGDNSMDLVIILLALITISTVITSIVRKDALKKIK
jgi:hypothetical protein